MSMLAKLHCLCETVAIFTLFSHWSMFCQCCLRYLVTLVNLVFHDRLGHMLLVQVNIYWVIVVYVRLFITLLLRLTLTHINSIILLTCFNSIILTVTIGAQLVLTVLFFPSQWCLPDTMLVKPSQWSWLLSQLVARMGNWTLTVTMVYRHSGAIANIAIM